MQDIVCLEALRPIARVLAAMAVVSTAGCRAPADPPPTAPAHPKATRIEILTRWDGREEPDALEALTREHTKRYPRDELVFSMGSNDFSSFDGKRLRIRIRAGEAPELFHANMGRNHMQWVIPSGYDDREALIRPLDTLLDHIPGWRTAMPPALLDQVTYRGRIYGVPVNAHVMNLLYYNKAVFAAHGIPLPRSLADLKSAGAKLRAVGIPLLAVGRREAWTLGTIAFESVMVAQEGPAFYRDYFSGRLAPEAPGMARTLRTTVELLRYAVPNAQSLSWFDAAKMVAAGDAAATVMGDWASVVYKRGGLGADDPIGEMAFPGTERVLVFTSDVFTLPAGSHNPEGAERVLETLASAQAQAAINIAKGSLPARLDASWKGMDPHRARKARIMRDGELLNALVGILPARFYEDVMQALTEMAEQGDPDPVLQALRSRYVLLRRR